MGHNYNIGTYDVTLTQYTAFLNSVAATDNYGLYNTNLATDLNIAGVSRSGTQGSYTYSVIGDGQRPVTYVSWFDAVRFTNWLTDGQTENGAYTITNGGNNSGTVSVPTTTQRAAWSMTGTGVFYMLPDENEWYKAAYYKTGSTNAGYWTYPTKSDTAPSNVISSTGTNNANFYGSAGFSITQSKSDSTSQNYLTDVGTFASSPGPYGTYDMGGDVHQLNDLNPDVASSSQGQRGGDFDGMFYELGSAARGSAARTTELAEYGFRVEEIGVAAPEPGSLLMLITCLCGIGIWKLCSRRSESGSFKH